MRRTDAKGWDGIVFDERLDREKCAQLTSEVGFYCRKLNRRAKKPGYRKIKALQKKINSYTEQVKRYKERIPIRLTQTPSIVQS